MEKRNIFNDVFYNTDGTQKYCLSCMLLIEQKIVDIVVSENGKKFSQVKNVSKIPRTTIINTKEKKNSIKANENVMSFSRVLKNFRALFKQSCFVTIKENERKNKVKNNYCVHAKNCNVQVNETATAVDDHLAVAKCIGDTNTKNEKCASQRILRLSLIHI